MRTRTRTLQQTGGQKVDGKKQGGSYLIILPKEWVDQYHLEKGSPVSVTEREDGCLVIDPRLQEKVESRTTEIPMESNLRWAITSKYLLGFDEIKIVSKAPITNTQRDELKRITKRFVALEVTDESEDQIVVQCLVDPSTLPVNKAMRRMNLIASRMLDDATNAYLQGLKTKAQDVRERDEEVDRLFFLIIRELRSAVQYPSISQKLGITPVSALDFRLAVQYIERIADLAVDIAAKTEDPVDKRVAKKMEPLVELVKSMLSQSVSNLFKFDTEKVNSVIAAEKKLISDVAKVRQEVISLTNGDLQAQLHVVDSLLRIGEAAKDIVDLALPGN